MENTCQYIETDENTCTICNKTYSGKFSLMNHNRIIHGIEDNRRKNKEDNCYHCKYCNNIYKFIQSRWKHQKACEKIHKTKEIIAAELQETIQRQKDQIIELQNKLLKCKRIDNKTFKAVNKILIDRSNNNTTIHNNITNNYQLVSLGNEDLLKVLTLKQKKIIMDSRLGSLEKIVEIAHCGNMNQFKNIIITNLKDNYAYRYDDTKGYFVTVTKDVLFDDVVTHRVTDIEEIYDELKSANKIDDRTKKLIQNFLDKMSNEDIPFFDSETKYNNFKCYKIDKIKILLYNNQDKITKDIALLISGTGNGFS